MGTPRREGAPDIWGKGGAEGRLACKRQGLLLGGHGGQQVLGRPSGVQGKPCFCVTANRVGKGPEPGRVTTWEEARASAAVTSVLPLSEQETPTPGDLGTAGLSPSSASRSPLVFSGLVSHL